MPSSKLRCGSISAGSMSSSQVSDNALLKSRLILNFMKTTKARVNIAVRPQNKLNQGETISVLSDGVQLKNVVEKTLSVM